MFIAMCRMKRPMNAAPKCRTVPVHLFRGNRGALGQRVRRDLDAQMHGRGPGPSALDCLLYAGHAGISLDSEPALIWGFNPDYGKDPLWQAMQNLRNGNAYPGIVTDDRHVFTAARSRRIRVRTFDVILPDPVFRVFDHELARERKKSRFTYGFPNGDGDCNCATWLERLGLPLISGSMDEFNTMTATSLYRRRRFGRCI